MTTTNRTSTPTRSQVAATATFLLIVLQNHTAHASVLGWIVGIVVPITDVDKARGGFLFRPTTPATVAAEVGKIREAQSLVAADLSKQIETKIPSTSSDDDGIIGIIRKNIEIENSTTNNNNNNSIETQSAVGGPSNPITVVVSDSNPRAHTAAGRGRDRGRSEAAGRGRSASGRDAGRGGRDGGRGRGRSVVGRGDGGQSGR